MASKQGVGVGITILFAILWQFRTVLEVFVSINVNTLYYTISILFISICVGIGWYYSSSRDEDNNDG